MSGLQAPGQLLFHFRPALRLALNLFSYSQALISPSLREAYNEQVVVECSEFVLHARRVKELSSLGIINGEMATLTRFSGGQVDRLKICSDYFESLNVIVHALELKIQYVINPTRDIFSDVDNLCISFLSAKTDRREEQNVSIYGISAYFLTVLAPKAIAKFPKSPELSAGAK